MTKYNADGSGFSTGPNEMEQGMGQGQGPLGQGVDIITTGPLVRQQTMGDVRCHSTHYCILHVCCFGRPCSTSDPAARLLGRHPTVAKCVEAVSYVSVCQCCRT